MYHSDSIFQKNFWRSLFARVREIGDIFLDYMALSLGIERKKKPKVLPTPIIPAERDARIQIPAYEGAPFESVGIITNSVIKRTGSCVYQGDGFALSAAHCFNQAARGEAQRTLAGFYCKIGRNGKTPVFKLGAEVVEIAIPENYVPEKDGRTLAESNGYDIAFLKLSPLTDKPFPQKIFPLKDKIDSLTVSQAGYNSDRIREGLTGTFNRSIYLLPEGKTDYLIHTNCPLVKGSSGSPLLDKKKNVIGIFESVTIADDRAVLTSRATPMTPGLKQAFERFKDGTLEGKVDILPNGVKVIRFPYERTPVLLPATPTQG